MKCLTITQPFAWAILQGKNIENRDWKTTYRGALVIHAAKTIRKGAYQEASEFICHVTSGLMIPPAIHDLALGAIVGVVELVDVVTHSASPWFCGTYGFVLSSPRTFRTPIPIQGCLGLWSPPPEVTDKIRRQEMI